MNVYTRTTLSTGSSHRCGFSAIELLIVVLIMGILAAVAIPKFNSSLLLYRGQLASKRLAADLDFAASYARSTSGPVKLSFTGQQSGESSGYSFNNVFDPHHSEKLLSIAFSKSPYDTLIESGPTDITFDLYGYPDVSAEWSLVGPSGDRFLVKIDKSTGKVSVK